MHKRPLEGHSAPTGLDKPTALVAFKSLSFCGSRFSSSRTGCTDHQCCARTDACGQGEPAFAAIKLELMQMLQQLLQLLQLLLQLLQLNCNY